MSISTQIIVGAAALVPSSLLVWVAFGQWQINKRQLALGELTLREKLFDRRFAVYETVQRFLSEIIRSGREPEGEIVGEFLLAVDRSKFLFRPEVQELLTRLWNLSIDIGAYQEQLDGSGSLPVGPERSATAQKKAETFKEIVGISASLSETFAPEMGLPSLSFLTTP